MSLSVQSLPVSVVCALCDADGRSCFADTDVEPESAGLPPIDRTRSSHTAERRAVRQHDACASIQLEYNINESVLLYSVQKTVNVSKCACVTLHVCNTKCRLCIK